MSLNELGGSGPSLLIAWTRLLVSYWTWTLGTKAHPHILYAWSQMFPFLELACLTHSHCSSYAFQIKKCTEPTCIQHPVRLPPEQFSELNHLPLPLLDASKEHFLKFEEVFGKPLSSKDQPSFVATPTQKQIQIQIDKLC